MKELFLQFGTGRFLRGFIGLHVDSIQSLLKQSGSLSVEGIAVQSHGSDRACLLKNGPEYEVSIQGMHKGALVQDLKAVRPYQTAYAAQSEWESVMEVTKSEDLKWIVSNATESGLSLEKDDLILEPHRTPKSFPAKLACILHLRFTNRLSPLWIIPCELVEYNADVLKELILEQSAHWGWSSDPGWENWVRGDGVIWVNTVVDQMVVDRVSEASHELDVQVEPFSSWILAPTAGKELPEPEAESLRLLLGSNSVKCVESIQPWAERKLRILNASHTLLVERWLRQDKKPEYVRQMMELDFVKEELRELLTQEVCPTLSQPDPGILNYVESTLERFSNPYLDHRLEAIAFGHEVKFKKRLQPVIDDYRLRFGIAPKRISGWLN